MVGWSRVEMKEEAFWHSRSSHQWLVGGGAMPGGGAFVFVFLCLFFLYLYFLADVFSFVAFFEFVFLALTDFAQRCICPCLYALSF